MLICTYTAQSQRARILRVHGADNAVAGNRAINALENLEPHVGAWDGDQIRTLLLDEFVVQECRNGEWVEIVRRAPTDDERRWYSPR